jgi:parallel beta-helix repeat protein
MTSLLASLLAAALAQVEPPALPTVLVSSDDTRLDKSCIVQIAKDAIIGDDNGDGVIHIAADGITIEFETGSILRGAAPDAPGNTLTGIGIRLHNHKDVVIKGANVTGFKIGIHATDCPGLWIDGADLSGNFRQRLKSTPEAEDGSDWMYPHHNDNGEWLDKYAAALSVRNASKVTIRNVRVRRGQNGIMLDRVTDSRIFDNDCSFLSGWGLSMWRSSRNLICRNALDFCIRGYSHKVYNRGQDSAGLLMFEQCSQNLIAENSITHGGDGIFGFAGREAIGEAPPSAPDFRYTRNGCNDNLIVGNDLSYAAAHGLEMTFSHGNQIANNRFVGNAICGIWGGYSHGMLIAENEFKDNGDMAYGLERGGVNIEHGSHNLIVGNTFENNACGIHLWWDDDARLMTLPGVKSAVESNIIADNLFRKDKIALQLRHAPGGTVSGTVFAKNRIEEVGQEIVADPGIEVTREGDSPMYILPPFQLVGETRPVGARSGLAGRHTIFMTEWGPWDHETPLARPITTSGTTHRYELLRMPPDARLRLDQIGGMSPQALNVSSGRSEIGGQLINIEARQPGVFGYTLIVESPRFKYEFSSSIIRAQWDVSLFEWTGSAQPPLPPADLVAWRALAKGPSAIRTTVDTLSFKFGSAGPKAVKSVPAFAASSIGGSFYGLVASTTLSMTPGKWRFIVQSDDGVRLLADGKPLIENWTHHGPTTDTAVLEVTEVRQVPIVVEYFQIAGHAVLDLRIEAVR